MKTKILIIIVIIFISCDYFDNRLKIKNNSNYAIAFDFSQDTIFNSINNVQAVLNNNIQPIGIKYFSMPGSRRSWSNYINNSKNKKLNIFIFSVDTLYKFYNWNYIISNKLYKRYEFTEDELDKMNWTIEYP